MSKLTTLRKWAARLMSPELALVEARLFRLRTELSSDRQWLGYDFPEVDIFTFRALVMDANYARGLDEPAYSLKAGGIEWSNDIAQFREQLRKRKALEDK